MSHDFSRVASPTAPGDCGVWPSITKTAEAAVTTITCPPMKPGKPRGKPKKMPQFPSPKRSSPK
jgi:hypothetical protein